MHKSLLLSVAMAPLCALAMGEAASAAQSITTARTTPIATSTAANGQPDDVTIESAGSITLTTPGPAVTLDSNNAVTNSGSIKITEQNGAVGVLLKGGVTGSFTNTASGVITVDEAYTATDTVNNDTIVEAPFAQGTGRYGVRLTGPGTFTGAISSAGSINAKGNNSYGVSIESALNGGLTMAGITLTGDSGVALNVAAPVTGPITLNGAIQALGQNSSSVVIGADVGGRLSLYSVVSTTAYTNTTRVAEPFLSKIQATPADVQQSGPAFVIAGNVAGGVLIGSPPSGTVTGSTADVDQDGVADGSQGAGGIAIFGSAPALQIGAAGRNVALGAVGTGQNAYGLIIRGGVNASGVYDNMSTTAVQIGVPNGTVNIAGGLRLVGTVAASSYNANATGVQIGAGSTVPEVRVEGLLSPNIAASTTAVTAQGLSIDAGANVKSLTVTGAISVDAVGNAASSVAVADRSGTLSSIVNQGSIAATLAPATAGATLTGVTTALDLRANTTGVSLVQQTNPSPGFTFGSESGKDTTTTTTPTAVVPSIVGDVFLGSGSDSVQLLAGSIGGALSFGAGNNSFTLDGGSVYAGTLTHSGTLGINLANGTLLNATTTATTLSSLSIGANSTLIVTADPANNTATRYNVTGPATLATGFKVGVALKSLLGAPQTYTIISSPNLSAASGAATLSTAIPFLYVGDLATNPTAGTVSLSLRRRTTAELGLNRSGSAAADAIYAVLPNDLPIQVAALQQINSAGLATLYNQLLPEHSGGSFLGAQLAAEAISRASAEPDVAEAGGLWASEIAYGMEGDAGVTPGFRSSGFGMVAGVEADSNIGAIGLTAAFVTGRAADHTLPGSNHLTVTQLQGGAYWRGQRKGLVFDASVSGGYALFKSRRQLIVGATDSTEAIGRTATDSWSGYSFQGRVGVAYEARQGRFYLRPNAHADYYRLHEGGHSEDGGGAGFNLIYEPRTGDAMSATASVIAGMTFGTDIRWRPQVEVGYRTVLSGDAGDTVVRFAGGTNFTLMANEVSGSGPIARVALVAEADYLRLVLEASAQKRKRIKSGDVRATVRARF